MSKVPVTVFKVEGTIDTNTNQELFDRAQEAHRQGMRNLVIELSQVTYISSAGLRAIHQIHTMLRENAPDENEQAVRQGIRDGSYKAHHLKLVNPSKEVLLVLKTAGFDMYLEILDRLPDAVASF